LKFYPVKAQLSANEIAGLLKQPGDD